MARKHVLGYVEVTPDVFDTGPQPPRQLGGLGFGSVAKGKAPGRPVAREVRVPVRYTGIDDLPIHFANAFLVQHSHGQQEFIVSFGHIAPPVLLGTPEQAKEQAEQIAFVQAKMLARFGVTEQRFRELVKLMSDYLAKYDQQKIAGKAK